VNSVSKRLATALAERYVLERELGHETEVPHANYGDVDPSGKRFVMIRHRGSSEILVLQNWTGLLPQEGGR
jgi:hypothetical protein